MDAKLGESMSFLELKNITKRFSGVEVLHSVNLSLEAGEIRAVLGANGAGKSTLMNIITGSVQANSGDIIIDGKKVKISDPVTAQKMGIAMVHQELSVVPTMAVVHNMFLGREIKRNCIVDMPAMRQKYEAMCDQYGFNIPGGAKVRDLSVAQRQIVEILRAVSFNARLLILDEPTTALAEKEKQQLFKIVRQLKSDGTTIIYITHNIGEVFTLADNATFFRNGSLVGTFPVSQLSFDKVSEYMSGTKRTHDSGRISHRIAGAAPVLTVEGLCRDKAVKNVSFELYPGEVLGLAGLVGAGRSEIVRSVFGADRPNSGRICVDGKEKTIKTPRDAIKSGIGMISEDRKKDGLVLKHSMFRNAVLTQLRSIKRNGLCSESVARNYMSSAAGRLSIIMNTVDDKVESLSGGNQQKVVISKWLMDDMRVLIFDEPTKGIDILAKEDVFKIVEDYTAVGVGVIFISSALDEVLRVSDRILVVSGGSIIGELENNGIDQKTIMDIILKHQEKNDEDKDR